MNSNTHIIAELAWGHDGSLDQAIKILKAAKDAGANSFSIHITNLPDYMVTYYGSGEGKVSAGRESLNVYKYLESINLKNEDWVEFNKIATEIGMPLCVMPNDIASLEFTEKQLNPKYYIISASCFSEDEFLKGLARKNKKTFFRIGGAYLGEIEKAVNIFREEGNDNIVLLHGYQNYPTKIKETNISLIKVLKEIFNTEVGLADHIDGGDEIALVIPCLAIAYGANYIEKHITWDRKEKSEDFESALNPKEFKKMVGFIRNSEIAIGKAVYGELSNATIRYRNIVRKRIVASRNLIEGDFLAIDDVCFKRSDIGLLPDQLDSIVGRKIKQKVLKDDSITKDKLV